MGVLNMRSQAPIASMKDVRFVSIRNTSESVSLAALTISEMTLAT